MSEARGESSRFECRYRQEDDVISLICASSRTQAVRELLHDSNLKLQASPSSGFIRQHLFVMVMILQYGAERRGRASRLELAV
jgi:hypothetical protein